ncbi:MAG: nascent polypeptide-associated complex protein [Nanoarchaeota archaeon]
MFGGLDPKKMSAVMKQMGISQTEIPADRVIIEKADGEGRIIIDNPQVVKVKMQGQESYQVTGEAREEAQVEENEETKLEADINTIVEQTGVDKEIAAIELEKNNGDIAETIISLSNQKHKKK